MSYVMNVTRKNSIYSLLDKVQCHNKLLSLFLSVSLFLSLFLSLSLSLFLSFYLYLVEKFVKNFVLLNKFLYNIFNKTWMMEIIIAQHFVCTSLKSFMMTLPDSMLCRHIGVPLFCFLCRLQVTISSRVITAID